MSHFTVINENNLKFNHLHPYSDEFLLNIHRTTKTYYATREVILKSYETGQPISGVYPDPKHIFYKKTVTNTNFPIGIGIETISNFSLPLKDFSQYSALCKKPDSEINNLPIATRYITKNGFYFIERPPFKTTIDFHKSGSSSKSKSAISGDVEIWIPWTLTIINPENPSETAIFLSHQQLSQNNDVYINSIFPNTYSNGRICFSNSLTSLNLANSTIVNNRVDIRHLYSLIINDYIGGGWNTDLTSNLHAVTSYSHLINKNNYPLLYKFLHIDSSALTNKYPKMRPSTISKFVNYFNKYSHTVYDFYKYMFYSLSLFTLEESLQFYSELAAFSEKNAHSLITVKFHSLLKDLEKRYPHEVRYELLPSAIASGLPNLVDNQNSGDIKRGVIVLTNYEKDYKLSELISGIGLNYPERMLAFIDPIIANELIQNINENSSDDHPVYILDMQTNTYTTHQTKNYIDYKNFISNYIIENYTKQADAPEGAFALDSNNIKVKVEVKNEF